MKNKLAKFGLSIFGLIFIILFVIKFGGPAILRLYVETGMGNCQNQPIFCIAPGEEINNPTIDKEYISGLTEHAYVDMEVMLPKGFKIVKGVTAKEYFKKRKQKNPEAAIYLLHKPPDFFTKLFPQIHKKGAFKDNYSFITLTMSAKSKDIANLNDAFFTIMKSIFTPNMGDQKNLQILKFNGFDKKGFISFDSLPGENYFDCNFVDSEGNFFKIYIKDKPASLDLNKILTIISTVKTRP